MKFFLSCLTVLLLCGNLSALDFRVHCNIPKIQKVPGFSIAKKLFLPEFILKAEQKMAEQNLKLPLKRFMIGYGDDGIFRFGLQYITADQFRYLLKYKILDFEYTEKQNDFCTEFVLPEHTVSFCKYGKGSGKTLEILTSPMAMKVSFPTWTVDDSEDSDLPALNGGFTVGDEQKKQIPFLQPVDFVEFSVLPDTEFLRAEITLTGEDREKIFTGTDAYFKMILAGAAQVGTLTPAHKEAFKVELTNSKLTVISVKLTPEMADAFFTVLHRLLMNGSANL